MYETNDIAEPTPKTSEHPAPIVHKYPEAQPEGASKV
jgi:hypothetical protein